MYILQTVLHTDGGQVLASNTGDSEQTFWIAMLMIVLVSSAVGLWVMIRKKSSEDSPQDEIYDYPATTQAAINHHTKMDYKLESLVENPASHSTRGLRRRKFADLGSGLELLELPFLVGVVSDTGGKSKLDAEMRKIAFTELARRERLGDVASKVLKVYAKNSACGGPKGGEGGFGKAIQCQAIRELSSRTKTQKHELVAIT